jgi:amino acid adenylation domain-containing protein
MRDLREIKAAAGQKIKERDFWKRRLSGEPVKSSFPYDYFYPGTASLSRTIEEVTSRWDGELFAQLMDISKQSDHALHIILVTALTALLGRYTGMEDITVGTPIYRQAGEGAFINTVLTIRNRLNPGMTFKQLLVQVKQTVLEAVKNQAYPVELLPELLNLPVSEGDFPLFDTALLLENIHDKEYMAPIDLNMGFRFLSTQKTIEAVVEYNASLYEASTIERIMGHFTRLMQNALSNLDSAVFDIEIRSGEEKRQLMVNFNDTGREYPSDRTIRQLFEEQAARTGDATAVVGMESLTYRELNRKSTQLAYVLREKGIRTNTIAALMVEPSVEMIIGILGILKAGAGYLPIDPGFPSARITYMLRDSDARLLLTRDHLAGTVAFGFSGETLSLEDDGLYTYKHTHKHNDKYDKYPGGSQPTDIAYMIYTSGTTGKPKGVLLQNNNLVNYVYWFVKTTALTAEDRTVLASSFAFDLGYTPVYTSLLTGCQLFMVSRETYLMPELFLNYITANRVSYIKVTPSLFNLVVNTPGFTAGKCHQLRLVVLGGEAINPDDVETAHRVCGHIEIMNHYGPTEAAIGSVAEMIDFSAYEAYKRRPSIGRPVFNTRVYIMDTHWKPLPPGIAGELCIAGEGLARGYLNSPELTTEKFNRDFQDYQDDQDEKGTDKNPLTSLPLYPSTPLYRTGDRARWLPDGRIRFLGRIDQQVKLRGFRIELGEIENQLSAHENIKEALVIIRSNQGDMDIDDKYLCAYIVPHSPFPGEPSLPLRDFLAEKLPGYMIPTFFMVLDTIPLTANGKVNRKGLPEPRSFFGAAEGYAAPRDSIETRLADLWSQLLGIEKNTIGIDANFFRLGGQSLKAAILTSKIHRAFDVMVPMRKIFEFPKLKDLAAYIKEADKAKYLSIQPTEEKAYYPLSSAQKRLYLVQQIDPRSITYNTTTIIALEGVPDKAVMENAFKQMIERHESLRTSFFPLDEALVQEVDKKVPFKLEYDEIKEDQVEESVKHFVRPFDLSNAPLLRVGLIKTAEKKYVLIADMHHIISDGVSRQVLIEEFRALYRGEILPGLRLQYKDFSQWQNRLVLSGQMKKQEAYWLNRFTGTLPVLKLPIDYTRPLTRRLQGSRFGFEIGGTEVEKLRHLARKQDTTLFMVMLTICNVFLSKLSGQEDIIVGTVTAGRSHADLEHIIGVFINTLALRNYPSGTRVFIDFLREVRLHTLEDFDNQDYQFEDLVDRVLDKRDTSRNPLFDVMFTFVSQEAESVSKEREESLDSKLTFKPYKTEYSESRFDLLISGVDQGDRFLFTMEYNTRLFKTGTIERFIDYFRQITAKAADDETIQLKDITLSTDLETASVSVFQDDDSDFGF